MENKLRSLFSHRVWVPCYLMLRQQEGSFPHKFRVFLKTSERFVPVENAIYDINIPLPPSPVIVPQKRELSEEEAVCALKEELGWDSCDAPAGAGFSLMPIIEGPAANALKKETILEAAAALRRYIDNSSWIKVGRYSTRSKDSVLFWNRNIF